MQIVRLFLLLAATPLYAGPQGGTVIDGTAAISVAGKVTTIDQLTDRAIINWQKFESTPTETIQFNQPGNLSLTLNRVVGVDPSFIGGALQANGGLFIVNPNGIVFGPNAQVNVNSLVASTLHITDADFKNGNFQFLQGPGELSSVINRGSIKAQDFGTVALLAPIVDNSGTIVAAVGRVILRAGLKAGIDTFEPTVPGSDIDPALGVASGRNVRMATVGLTPVLEDVVNTQSTVAANKITRLADGTVFLRGAGGIAVNSGTIDVTLPFGPAGRIEVRADHGIGLGAGSTMRAGTAGSGGLLEVNAFRITPSQPPGTTGRAVLEADLVGITTEAGGVDANAGSLLEVRGGTLALKADNFGSTASPVRLNTSRLSGYALGTSGFVSDGDLTLDFMFANGPSKLNVAGSLIAGLGGDTFVTIASGPPLIHAIGFNEITAGTRIGSPTEPIAIGVAPDFSNAPVAAAPNGVDTVFSIVSDIGLPGPIVSVNLDDVSAPQPRANYTPPFDAVPGAPDAAPAPTSTVLGGATAAIVTSTGGGAIVVQTGSSSSSAPTVGARDNVLLTSSRSSLVKQDSAGGPATGGGDVVVVKNDAPDGEGDAEGDQPERKRRSATRAND